MGKTSIEWTDASWNPIVGCTEVSPGCANCYAARVAATRLRNTPQYAGLAHTDAFPLPGESPKPKTRTGWTGEVRFLPDRLEEPLHWRKPRRIFVCDMGDLFHDGVLEDWLFSIFGVMALCQRHTFQVLTKRPEKMLSFLGDIEGAAGFVSRAFQKIGPWPTCDMARIWPLPNVWLGVSVENQHFADARIPLLLGTPAAVRWISAEPLLGPLDLNQSQYRVPAYAWRGTAPMRIDWLVCGGESGPNARSMHPDWARSLRDQCQAAGVPFFFKQWGEWLPQCQLAATGMVETGRHVGKRVDEGNFVKFGKKLSGRLLDGREWNEFPRVGQEKLP